MTGSAGNHPAGPVAGLLFTYRPRRAGLSLIVDDNPDNQRIIQFLLKNTGDAITLADDGRMVCDRVQAALDRKQPFRHHPPRYADAGHGRLRRRRGIWTPIIALAALAMPGDEQKCLAADCNVFVSEPVVSQALYQNISVLCRHVNCHS